MVVQDLKNVVKDLIEDDQFPTINVEIVDNDLAKIYANSIKAQVGFHVPLCFCIMILLTSIFY